MDMATDKARASTNDTFIRLFGAILIPRSFSFVKSFFYIFSDIYTVFFLICMKTTRTCILLCISGPFHFILFSRVWVLRADRCTRFNPYSAVRINDFGRSSQGTTSPCRSASARNRRVLGEVLVLSISKIPITEESRTAISFPMERYMVYTSPFRDFHWATAISSQRLFFGLSLCPLTQ